MIDAFERVRQPGFLSGKGMGSYELQSYMNSWSMRTPGDSIWSETVLPILLHEIGDEVDG